MLKHFKDWETAVIVLVILVIFTVGLLPCMILAFFKSWFRCRPYRVCIEFYMDKWFRLTRIIVS